MTAPRLSLEGLPMEISTALSRFFLAAVDAGGAKADDDEASFLATGNACALRRGELVAAIKAAIAISAAPTLLHAQHITLDSLDTTEADARAPRPEFLPIGDDFPELPHATPAVGAVLRQVAAAQVCACFDGLCRCEVVDGRTATGAHCKAHLAPSLGEDAS